MSVKKNIIANYISQIYVAGIGILILPLYIKYMGAEAYGLVGFFTMLQAAFSLLDMGLTPTIARETARFQGGAMSSLQYRQLFRSLSVIFYSVALIGGGLLWILAEPIAHNWLKVSDLAISVIVGSVQVMAISVALRWICGLYRGVVTGYEKLVWLSGFNFAIATIRFPGVLVSMWFFGYSPTVFFFHQLAVAFMEVLGLFLKSNSLKPKQEKGLAIGWTFKPIKPLLKFSLTIAFTSAVWILVTQTDKLILSGILQLEDYGYFTLSVLVASGIMFLSSPISSVIMPRMTRLHTEGMHSEKLRVYLNFTNLVSIVSGSASLVLAFYANDILFLWTGDKVIAEKSATILTLYAIGNGLLAVSAFPYYLQYAIGNLRYHVIGNFVIFITIIPAVIVAAKHYGAVGAGYVWLTVNVLYFVGWVAYVHVKLSPKLHSLWLRDVLTIYLTCSVFLSLLSLVSFEIENRIFLFLKVVSVLIFTLIVGLISSNVFRSKFISYIKG